MKICPTCKKTYSDESLNFCLDDGTVLNQFSEDDNSQPTVFMGQPPVTAPNTVVSSQGSDPVVNQFGAAPPQTYSPQQQKGLSHTVPQRPVKKSRTWLWVVGILGVILVIGGIGLVGLLALIASNMDDPDNPADNSQISDNKKDTSPTPVVFRNVLKDDFSKWRVDTNNFGKTEFRGDIL